MNEKMYEIIDEVVKSRCGGKVERCHTIPHTTSYNNAAHSWGVAMLMWYLFPHDYPRLSIYCLTHDIGEAWMGDIPAPALWAIEGVREKWQSFEDELVYKAGCPKESLLPEADKVKLKACDRLELYLWCREQELMGNHFVKDCIQVLEEYFDSENLPGRAWIFYYTVKSMPDFNLLPRQRGIVQELIDELKG